MEGQKTIEKLELQVKLLKERLGVITMYEKKVERLEKENKELKQMLKCKMVK